MADVDKVMTTLPERRIQATHGRFSNDIAPMRGALLPIIETEPQQVVDDLRGF